MLWTQQKQKILRRGGKETQKNYTKKILMTQITTMVVITHLESDILECEVKWALGSITTNKVSGGDGIPVELFQILKDDAVKVLHSLGPPRGMVWGGRREEGSGWGTHVYLWWIHFICDVTL